MPVIMVHASNTGRVQVCNEKKDIRTKNNQPLGMWVQLNLRKMDGRKGKINSHKLSDL